MLRPVQLLALAAITALVLAAPLTIAQVPEIAPTQIIDEPAQPSPPEIDFNFGCSVSVDGNLAAVHASLLQKVFIYEREHRRDAWTERQQIDVSNIDVCGLALHDATLIIDTGGSLSVYRDDGTAFIFDELITPDDGSRLSGVILDGETVVSSGRGATYVFVRTGNTWTQQARLVRPDGVPPRAVALDQNTLLIGPELIGPDGPVEGPVNVFVRTDSTWTHQQALTPTGEVPFGNFGVQFGEAAAVFQNVAVIGAPDDAEVLTDIGFPAGAAFVFVRKGDTWTQVQKLTTPFDSQTNSYAGFGRTFAMDRKLIVVGAPSPDDQISPKSGSIYFFVRHGHVWTEDLRSSPGGFHFGESLSLSGKTLLVGAPGCVSCPMPPGFVAFYELRPPPKEAGNAAP